VGCPLQTLHKLQSDAARFLMHLDRGELDAQSPTVRESIRRRTGAGLKPEEAMKPGIAVAFAFLVLFTAQAVVFAKGTTTKVVITGGGLGSPVEISDLATLKNFNVWSGPGTRMNGVEGRDGFIVNWPAGVVSERPRGLFTFELSFYVRYANRPFDEQPDQLAYVVSYALDPATGQGYVYLPGRNDRYYQLNTKAILRGVEGKWFRATPAWQNMFSAVVHR
jgi:hypothetical protein